MRYKKQNNDKNPHEIKTFPLLVFQTASSGVPGEFSACRKDLSLAFYQRCTPVVLKFGLNILHSLGVI